MRNIDSDLIRGNIDTIILKTMLEEDKYGLDIIKEVEQRSSGTYELKQPTLYSCLKRLENQELITSYWLDSDIGGRRHYYKLTEKGREFYNKKQEEWAKSKFIIDNLLSNYDYEEYRLVKKDEYDQIQQDKEMIASGAYKSQSASNSAFESAMSGNTLSNITPEETDDEPVEESLEETDETTTIDELIEENKSAYDEEDEYSKIDEIVSEEDDEDNNFSVDGTELNFSMDEHFDEDHEHDEDFETTQPEDFDETEEELNTEHLDFFSNNVENEEETDDSPIYYSSQEVEPEEETEPTISYPQADQTNNELNILRSLHSQEDEEINTYYGDKSSYVNHLNKDVETEQQSLLDANLYNTVNEVDNSINNFSETISRLNNFNSSRIDAEPENNTEESEDEDFETHENSDFRDEFNQTDSPEWIETEETEQPEVDELDELKSLNPHSSTGFFKSFDDTDYSKTSTKEIIDSINDDEPDYDYLETDSSDASFENDKKFDAYEEYLFGANTVENDYNTDEDENDFNPPNYEETEEETEELTFNFGGNTTDKQEVCNIVSKETSTESFEERNPDCFVDFRTNTEHRYEQTNFDDINEIISNNATNTFSYDDAIFAPMEVKPTQNQNYKQKLSNLSAYSKVSIDDEPEVRNNEEALKKAKDISELTKEFEEEGIVVKQHYKNSTARNFDRSYLLTNKINLVKSMILFFGYIFLLSGIYIVLNNTSFSESYGFSIKYFLYGFIPFAVIMLCRVAMFLINPYKKSPARYASRIMMFISIIITIQLLLITYCVNLQLGFYSFSQLGYNHLYWIIPTIISFAPIADNLIYMALYNSKNFHV